MRTSERFDQALNKLYNAFHQGTLNPECCNHCAVGNICDNRDAWKNFTDSHGSTRLNYVGIVNENFGRTFNGYRPSELLKIEAAFLKGCGYSLPFSQRGRRPRNRRSKEMLFNGLSAAVAYLCQLEGIADVMDCSELFNYMPREKTGIHEDVEEGSRAIEDEKAALA